MGSALEIAAASLMTVEPTPYDLCLKVMLSRQLAMFSGFRHCPPCIIKIRRLGLAPGNIGYVTTVNGRSNSGGLPDISGWADRGLRK